MLVVLRPLLNAWHRRRAAPMPEARASVAALRPATVVTGGSQGIGRALARCAAKDGHTVVLVARRPELLEEAAADIRDVTTNPVLACALDITAANAPLHLDAFLAQNGLYAAILVNNAGMGSGGRFDARPVDEANQLVDLNLAALTRLMRHVLPGMRDRAEGGVLNVASLGGFCPGPYQAAYYASKAYVISLTEAVAYEMAGEGVRLSVLAPGPVETRFHARMGADDSLYRWLIPAMSADDVANSGWRGFMSWQRVIVPGLVPRGLSLALRVLPHPIIVPIVGWLLAPRSVAKKVDM